MQLVSSYEYLLCMHAKSEFVHCMYRCLCVYVCVYMYVYSVFHIVYCFALCELIV